MLLNASLAVTVTDCATPAVDGFASPPTAKCVAAPGPTVTVCEPLIAAFEVSVAVSVREPVETKVAPGVNVCVPASPAVKV